MKKGTCTNRNLGHTEKVSTGDLDIVLSGMWMPEGVMVRVVERYKERYPWALAKNAALGSAGGVLLKSGLCSADAVEVVEKGDLSSLEAVLSSKEKRGSVLQAVMDTYALSARDQMRLVRRSTSVRSANRILNMRATCDEARRVAALRADRTQRAEYVMEKFYNLDSIRDIVLCAGGSGDTMINGAALVAWRSLRSEALVKDISATRAATWVELAGDDWELAARVARKSLSGAGQDPLVGMLAQPSLPQGLYDELRPLAGREQLELLEYACGSDGPDVRVATLGTCSDKEAARLIKQYGAEQRREGFEARWNVLEGLSWNQFIVAGGATSTLLVEAIVQQMEWGGGLDRWLWAALERACGIELRRSGAEVLQKRGYTTWGAQRFTSKSPDAKAPVVSAARVAPRGISSGLVTKKWATYSLNEMLDKYGQWQLVGLGQEIEKRIGNGSKEESAEKWMVFLALLEDGPSVALGQLLEAAETLVHAKRSI
jgi:hypothetical protein